MKSASGHGDAWIHQPARKDSASGLWARGRGSRPAAPVGLSLLARGQGLDHRYVRTQPPCQGSVSSTSLPGGTQPAGAVHHDQPAGQAGNSLGTLGCGAQTVSSAVLSLRALAAGVDHLARRDLGPKRPRTPARAKTGARVPCDRRVAFRPFPTPRGLRSVGGGGGFEGIGVETVVGVEARCGTVAPARRRLRGYSVACQAHGHRGPTAQGLLSQSPYRCRGRAVEAGSSEADVVCRDGIGPTAGRRVALAAR